MQAPDPEAVCERHLVSPETSRRTSVRPSPHSPQRRGPARRVLVALVAMVAVLVAAACEPVHPVRVPYQTPADDAAAWIAADVAANGHTHTAGMQADVILALAATAGDREVAEAVLAELEAATPGYVQPSGFFNPGAAGKVLLAVQAVRFNGNDFAGLDLEALLRGSLITEGENAGRFGAASLFNQTLATMALARTPGKAPASAGAWIADQQCPDGSFSWGNCSFADADHTSMAVQAMAAAGGQQQAVADGISWLLDHQLDDGGFNAGSGDSNANSTGLAAQALRIGGHHDAADEAADWVRSIQKSDGSIPWTAGFDSNLLMATTQGVLAFGAGPFHQLAFARIVGAPCPEVDSGVTVVVDLARYDGTIKVACAPGEPASGWAALEAAGFEVGSVPGYEGSAICTIEGAPTTGYPDCWNAGFWAYFHDEARADEWAFSNFGAAGRTPPPGSVEGWRYEPDWQTHDASFPGINPLWRQQCLAPNLPVISPIAADEVLPVQGNQGEPVEVAVLDGSEPLTLEVLQGLTWTEATEVSLAGRSGPTLILARSASPTCNPSEPAELFAAVYDVQPTYPGRSGTEGNPAVAAASAEITGWATGYSEYVAGANVNAGFQTPANAAGPPSTGLVVLGDNGSITLTFDEVISDGTGPDLAVFENGFGLSGQANDFLELGYVEVSSNGQDFVRFATGSRQATPVGGFQGQPANLLGGMAGRDLANWGTPFDLAHLEATPEVRSGLVDLSAITHVRIVDIVGDGSALDSFGRPIYDAHPTTGSAGFDLTAVAVLGAA